MKKIPNDLLRDSEFLKQLIKCNPKCLFWIDIKYLTLELVSFASEHNSYALTIAYYIRQQDRKIYENIVLKAIQKNNVFLKHVTQYLGEDNCVIAKYKYKSIGIPLWHFAQRLFNMSLIEHLFPPEVVEIICRLPEGIEKIYIVRVYEYMAENTELDCIRFFCKVLLGRYNDTSIVIDGDDP